MTELPPEVKPAYLSKTIYANLIMALVALISIWVPSLKEYMNGANVAMIFAFINIILRAVTKSKLVLW